jgi:hypothetical protein
MLSCYIRLEYYTYIYFLCTYTVIRIRIGYNYFYYYSFIIYPHVTDATLSGLVGTVLSENEVMV